MEYPLWLQIVLALSVSCALMGLGGFMLFTTFTKAMRAASALEIKRSHREAEALNNWQKLYEEEKQKRLQDVGDLAVENSKLFCQNKRMKAILEKAKVKDL